jgi:hypothetical protein
VPLEKGSPVGTFDNSPAIYRWVTCSYIFLVPQGRLKIGNYSAVCNRWIFSLAPDFSPVSNVSPDAFFNRFNGFWHMTERLQLPLLYSSEVLYSEKGF